MCSRKDDIQQQNGSNLGVRLMVENTCLTADDYIGMMEEERTYELKEEDRKEKINPEEKE